MSIVALVDFVFTYYYMIPRVGIKNSGGVITYDIYTSILSHHHKLQTYLIQHI